jgi:hypothetical protein
VAERDLAAVAGEDVQAEQRDGVHQHQRELERAVVADEERQRAGNNQQNYYQENLVLHTRVTWTLPKKPEGLNSSTPMISTSATESLSSLPMTKAPSTFLQHADDEAADHRPHRAVDAADQRRGEGVEQDAAHHVRVEVDDRRHHHAGDRADRRGEAPAERQHPADADADQPARHRVLRGGAHGEAERREAEEDVQRRQHQQRDADGAQLVRRHVPAERHLLGNGLGNDLMV